MHEDNFLSSRLREDGEGKEEKRRLTRRPEKSVEEVEKEEGRKERTKRLLLKEGGCVNPVSGDAFEEFSHVEESWEFLE